MGGPQHVTLSYMDTDSIHFETDFNMYKILSECKEFASLFDLSPFPKDFKDKYNYSDENKGKIGTWKVEVCSSPADESKSKKEELDQIVSFECLRAKSYSMVLMSSNETKIKTKGVKMQVANTLSHENFQHINRSSDELTITQPTFRSNDHTISTIKTTIANAFSNNDTKRVLDIRYFFII
jgi:hypothetical protein